jgi:hypothetical protein
MFGNDPRDLTKALSEMEYEARQKTNFNKVEAKQKMVEWLSQDRRFDGYDVQRLADRVQLSKYNGAVLDLTDPQLKGQSPRPGDRRW